MQRYSEKLTLNGFRKFLSFIKTYNKNLRVQKCPPSYPNQS